jgi:hypothetical protein
MAALAETKIAASAPGISFVSGVLGPKRLELLRALVPKATTE